MRVGRASAQTAALSRALSAPAPDSPKLRRSSRIASYGRGSRAASPASSYGGGSEHEDMDEAYVRRLEGRDRDGAGSPGGAHAPPPNAQ